MLPEGERGGGDAITTMEVEMKIDEEILIQNADGKRLILQKVSRGISYLDFGMTHLDRGFEGYKVKYMDRTATPLPDGSFKLNDTGEVFAKVQR